MSTPEVTLQRRSGTTPAAVLRAIVAFSVLSTAIHYTHNFVEIGQYPTGSFGDTAVQVAIVVSWPLLTPIGLLGYRLWTRGRYRAAHACLLLYAPLGLVTPAHFLQGTPDVSAFWMATIFTDGLAGLLLVGFVAWSWRTRGA